MKKLSIKIMTILIVSLLVIPSVYAFYFSNYQSSIISSFLINTNLSDSYVRATILTYWIDNNSCTSTTDLTTCNISGKSSWTINSDVINPDWLLLEDGYYYYKSSINGKEINQDNIKTHNIALINPDTPLENLTNEVFTNSEIIPQYEIIYEFIENKAIESSWNVSYENDIPIILDN